MVEFGIWCTFFLFFDHLWWMKMYTFIIRCSLLLQKVDTPSKYRLYIHICLHENVWFLRVCPSSSIISYHIINPHQFWSSLGYCWVQFSVENLDCSFARGPTQNMTCENQFSFFLALLYKNKRQKSQIRHLSCIWCNTFSFETLYILKTFRIFKWQMHKTHNDKLSNELKDAVRDAAALNNDKSPLDTLCK